MDLTIVIVNYRTPGDVIACLQSLDRHDRTAVRFRVVLVDNASGDDSVELIRQAIAAQHWHSWVDFVPLPDNGGYAAGNNAGIRCDFQQPDPAPYILLLNPDTLVRAEALTRLVQFMETNPQVGIAGSRLEDPDGAPQCSAFRFPTLWSELEGTMRLGLISSLLRRWVIAPPPQNQAHATDWVAGASMILRRRMIEKIGLLDEAYFMYFEEVDYCHKARRAGWPCWYVPASRVVHLVGRSSGVTDTRRQPRRRPAYWYQSRRRYFLRHHGILGSVFADLAFVTGVLGWRIKRRLRKHRIIDPPYLLWDLLRHSVLLSPSRT